MNFSKDVPFEMKKKVVIRVTLWIQVKHKG